MDDQAQDVPVGTSRHCLDPEEPRSMIFIKVGNKVVCTFAPRIGPCVLQAISRHGHDVVRPRDAKI